MNYDDLLTREKSVLEYIQDHVYRYGYAPSVRDIAKAIGVKSTSTVHGYLKQLEEKGYIRRSPSKNRSIELINEEEWRQKSLSPIPLVGQVRAGVPITATELIEDVYPFPTQFIGSEDVFMLSVKGDSMIDEGIFEGDLLFVQRQNVANNGDIVVALVDDDEATVKTFYREKDYIRLQPANDLYEPIRGKNIKVLGKVVGVYRKYN